MNSSMKIIMYGNPLSKSRHRHFSHGGFVKTYDPQEKQKNKVKKFLSESLTAEYQNLLQDAFFEVKLDFYLPIPKSFNRAKKNHVLWGFNIPSSKKDVDNMAKFILDCANGVLFPDDHMITKLTCSKSHSLHPRTEIVIMATKTKSVDEISNEILGIYGPEEIGELIEEIALLSNLYNEYLEGSERDDIFQSLAIQVAVIAEKHAKSLSSVSKKSFRDGKTLC